MTIPNSLNTRSILVSISLLGGVGGAANGQSFQGLGDLDGGTFYSYARGISDDGLVVAGRSRSNAGLGVFKWTELGGMERLGDLSGGSFSSFAYAVSGDGNVIVGRGTSSGGNEAFRWNELDGMQGLGDLTGTLVNSQAYGVNADGSVIVGQGVSVNGNEAFRWTSSSGMQGIGDLSGGDFESRATDVSGDGNVIVGRSKSAASGAGYEAFVWTPLNQMQGIGDLPGGTFNSQAHGVSLDGTVVVGQGTSANGTEAFRWTSKDQMQPLGDLAGGTFSSIAYGVSSDGSTIVGASQSANGQEAFVWTSADGMRSIADILTAADVDIAGWTLSQARAVSADGRIITGWGQNPEGDTEAWIVSFSTVEATFLLHATHGQVPEEFVTFLSPDTPAWISNLPEGITSKIDTANMIREDAGYSMVGFQGSFTDWTVETGVGTPRIAFSRICDLWAELITDQATKADLRSSARFLESDGRRRASLSTGSVAGQMYQQLKTTIAEIRKNNGAEHPIYLDIVSHSRGTLVTSEALRLLAADGDGVSEGLLEINVLYADIIDSSEVPLVRPQALAGQLLGGPVVNRHASERVHHLVSDCAVFCLNPGCSISDPWFFTEAQYCEFIDRFLDHYGIDITDQYLREHGYPQGRLRSSASFNIEYEAVVPNATHATLIDQFVQSAIDIDPLVPQPVLPQNFGSRMAVGRFLTSELMSELPEIKPFLSSSRLRQVIDNSALLITDPDFSDMGEFAESSINILTDPEIDELLTPAYQNIRDILENASTSLYPEISSWDPLLSSSVVLINEGNGEFSVQVLTGGLEQFIGADLAGEQQWQIEAELTLDAESAAADIELATASGVQASWGFSSKSGDPINERIVMSTEYLWDNAEQPTISISGAGFTVHRLDVLLVPECQADLNDDGVLDFFDVSAFLQAFGTMDPLADFTGDGSFDFFDVSAFLQAFSTGCP